MDTRPPSSTPESEPSPENRAPRSTLGKAATFRSRGSLVTDATIENLSRTGCRLTSGATIEIGTVVSIAIEGLDPQAARIVRSDEQGQGCQFLFELTDAQVKIALMATAVVNVAFPEMRGRVRADAASRREAPGVAPVSRWRRMLSALR